MQSCINPSRTCDTITYCIRRRETLGVRDNMHVTYIAKIGDDCRQVQLLTAPAWICAQPGDVFTTSPFCSAFDQFRKYVKKEEQNVRSIPKAVIQWIPVKKEEKSSDLTLYPTPCPLQRETVVYWHGVTVCLQETDGNRSDNVGVDSESSGSDSDSDCEEEQTMDI